jgi:hypothetical protein
MDIGKSFSFQFEDKDWFIKLGLGALIAVVPILNFAWTGYMVEIMRNVIQRAAAPLPTWDDFAKKFVDGLILFAAGLIYAAPMLLLLCLPLGIIGFSSLLAEEGDLRDVAEVVAGAGGVLFLCLLCLIIVYSLALSVVYPAILVLFAREGTFAACFKFRAALDLIKRNSASFLTAWGLSLVVSLGVGFVVGLLNGMFSWIPCVGWLAGLALGLGSTVYISSFYAHLFGQFAIEGGEPAPPAAAA